MVRSCNWSEDKRAWHAGVSQWGDITDVNSHSIGIEIVNRGMNGATAHTRMRQITAVMDLVKGIMQRWDIKPENVLGHSDVAPGRKQDPGELFPWDRLEAAGLAFVERRK